MYAVRDDCSPLSQFRPHAASQGSAQDLPGYSSATVDARLSDIQRVALRWVWDFAVCCQLVLSTSLPDPPAQGLQAPRHTCSSTRIFVSGFLHLLLTERDSASDYPSPPSGWVWTSLDGMTIIRPESPVSSRANPAHNPMVSAQVRETLENHGDNGVWVRWP